MDWLRKRLSKGNLLIKRLRMTVFCINLFFVIMGLLVFSVGIFTYVEYHPYKELLVGDHLWLHGIGLVVIGGVTAVITILCFCGKIRKSPCMLLYFLMVLSVIYLFEIVCGIAGIVEKAKLDEILTNNLNKTFNDDGSSGEIWKHLQSKMKCCGINDADDWRRNNKRIPKSCCDDWSTEEEYCSKEAAWKIGCKSPIINHFELITAISAGLSISLGCVQLMVIGCAFYSYKLFRDNFGEHIEIFLK